MAKKDDDKVSQDIIDRDSKDIDKGYRGSYAYRTSVGAVPLYPDEYGKLKNTDKMAYKDALTREYRRGDNWTLAEDAGIDPKLQGKPFSRAEGDATRARLLKRYGVDKKKTNPVKKMAKGGSASKRADGCCSKGKTRGKFV